VNLNQENLESLLSNKFNIDCIQIALTQQKNDDPIVYLGSGSIFQREDGNFHLKLYHSIKDFSKEVMPSFDNIKPGKLLGKERYFSMQAIDMQGNIWESNDISVSEGFSLPAAGKVINTTIRKLSCTQKTSEVVDINTSFLFLVLPGKYRIPSNHWEDLPQGARSLSICKIQISGITIEINDRKNCITIKAEDPTGKMNDSFKGRFTEALSIVFGKLTPVLYSSLSLGNTKISVLSSIPADVPNLSIASPIKHDAPWEAGNFQEFIEKYIANFTLEHEQFFGYWHKINRAWQGGIENAALSLCTAIEGITKNYYSAYGQPEAEIVQQAEDAKKIIKDSAIGDRIKNRIMANLGQAKSPSPKNSLYKLASESKFEKDLVDSWVSLRNKSAHADNLDEDTEELQKYIDDVYKCLNLFNVLLLLKIDFNGTYQDFSKDEWGESQLFLDSEDAQENGA
jgi:hypothetical protein